MRRLFGLVLAGALISGMASSADAQFSLGIGNAYGGGLSINSGYGTGLGYPGYGLGYPAGGYGVGYPGVYGTNVTGYSNLGYGYGTGYGLGGYGYSSGYRGVVGPNYAYGYRNYGYAPYAGGYRYRRGFRPFGGMFR